MKNLRYVAFSLVLLIGAMGKEAMAMDSGATLDQKITTILGLSPRPAVNDPDPLLAALGRSGEKLEQCSAASKFRTNPVVTLVNIDDANNNRDAIERFKALNELYKKTSQLRHSIVGDNVIFDSSNSSQNSSDIVGLYNYTMTHLEIIQSLIETNENLPRARWIASRGKQYSESLQTQLLFELNFFTEKAADAEELINNKYNATIAITRPVIESALPAGSQKGSPTRRKTRLSFSSGRSTSRKGRSTSPKRRSTSPKPTSTSE